MKPVKSITYEGDMVDPNAKFDEFNFNDNALTPFSSTHIQDLSIAAEESKIEENRVYFTFYQLKLSKLWRVTIYGRLAEDIIEIPNIIYS
jgi:hypothetical protein